MDLPKKVAGPIAKAVGESIKEDAAERTPTAEMPLAYFFEGGSVRWIRDRKGRRPGTLKAKWEVGEPELSAEGAEVEIRNTDPIAIYVEEDTSPHLIVAKRARFLRFPMGTTFMYRRAVNHPGTQGQHMLRDAMAAGEADWRRIADEVIDAEMRRS